MGWTLSLFLIPEAKLHVAEHKDKRHDYTNNRHAQHHLAEVLKLAGLYDLYALQQHEDGEAQYEQAYDKIGKAMAEICLRCKHSNYKKCLVIEARTHKAGNKPAQAQQEEVAVSYIYQYVVKHYLPLCHCATKL